MTNKTYITTGKSLLDNILSSGVPSGYINVIYGKSNLGKSFSKRNTIRALRSIKIRKILYKLEENV